MKSNCFSSLIILTLFCLSAAALPAAPNISPQTALVVDCAAVPYIHAANHPGNGQLWYVLNAAKVTEASWYESSIRITSPGGPGGYMVVHTNGAATQDVSLSADPGEKVRALDFLVPGDAFYAVVIFNQTAPAEAVSFEFTVTKREVPAAPNPRLLTQAAPFSITGTFPGLASGYAIDYTAPEAGRYTFTTSTAPSSNYWSWDVWLEGLGDFDSSVTENLVPKVQSIALPAGGSIRLSAGQHEPALDTAGGIPLNYTLSATLLPLTAYEHWTLTQLTIPENARPERADPTADPDQDGLPNLMEYALGGSIVTPDTTRLPAAVPGGGGLQLRYTRPKGRMGLVYTVKAALDPAGPWSAIGVELVSRTEQVTEETVLSRLPAPPSGRGFLRLEVTTAITP